MIGNERLEILIKSFLEKVGTNKLCFITGGGTSVPIEKQTIRKITNISTGKRSALCTEYFLNSGYFVILLCAKSSLKPYLHRLNNIFYSDGKSVDLFESVRSDYEKSKDRLLLVEFDYLQEYLELLEIFINLISEKRIPAIYILAAAVSDYFIPDKYMPEHKFSNDDIYDILKHLSPTPKNLKELHNKIEKNSLFVTFKLETNQNVLDENCKKAIRNIGHQVVVGNVLKSKDKELWIYQKEKVERIEKQEDYIEKHIVEKLISMHIDLLTE